MLVWMLVLLFFSKVHNFVFPKLGVLSNRPLTFSIQFLISRSVGPHSLKSFGDRGVRFCFPIGVVLNWPKRLSSYLDPTQTGHPRSTRLTPVDSDRLCLGSWDRRERGEGGHGFDFLFGPSMSPDPLRWVHPDQGSMSRLVVFPFLN